MQVIRGLEKKEEKKENKTKKLTNCGLIIGFFPNFDLFRIMKDSFFSSLFFILL